MLKGGDRGVVKVLPATCWCHTGIFSPTSRTTANCGSASALASQQRFLPTLLMYLSYVKVYTCVDSNLFYHKGGKSCQIIYLTNVTLLWHKLIPILNTYSQHANRLATQLHAAFRAAWIHNKISLSGRPALHTARTRTHRHWGPVLQGQVNMVV